MKKKNHSSHKVVRQLCKLWAGFSVLLPWTRPSSLYPHPFWEEEKASWEEGTALRQAGLYSKSEELPGAQRGDQEAKKAGLARLPWREAAHPRATQWTAQWGTQGHSVAWTQ